MTKFQNVWNCGIASCPLESATQVRFSGEICYLKSDLVEQGFSSFFPIFFHICCTNWHAPIWKNHQIQQIFCKIWRNALFILPSTTSTHFSNFHGTAATRKPDFGYPFWFLPLVLCIFVSCRFCIFTAGYLILQFTTNHKRMIVLPVVYSRY